MAVFRLACVLVIAASALAQDSFGSPGVRVVMKVFDDCNKAEAFSPCIKKKAITFFDRLSRMDKLELTDGVTVIRDTSVVNTEPAITEEQIDSTLPRSGDAKEEALNKMLIEKAANFISSRILEVTMPKMGDIGIEEGRKKNKGGGMMGGMMMGIAAKMAALIPVAIAGLFLLAGKALITAKIALLISGIIALKKLFAKHGGGGGGHGGGGHGGWQSSGGGGGGGWQSSSGGGWDKRSIDAAHKLAYKTYVPK